MQDSLFNSIHMFGKLVIINLKSKIDTLLTKNVDFWRRRGDSNSRAGYPTYALSRGASSPT